MSRSTDLVLTTVKDKTTFLEALGERAKEFGITKLVGATQIPASHLYQMFSSKGNPTLESLLKVMEALGIQLQADAK